MPAHESDVDGALAVVLTTLPDRAAADALADRLLAEELVACVQFESIDSRYRWQGRIGQSAEIRLVLKTRRALAPALMARIGELHPYEVPQLIELAVQSAGRAYADWVRDCTGLPQTGTGGTRGIR